MATINPKTLYAMLTGQTTNTMDIGLFEYLMGVAERLIIAYTKNPNLDLTVYQNEVVELSAHIYNVQQMNIKSIENGNVKSLSNSGRSVAFMSAEEINSIVIPKHILARLPKPRVRIW